jgi:hypothetical protein
MISRSMDNDLRTDEQAVLQSHLNECPVCRRAAEQYGQLQHLLNDTCALPSKAVVHARPLVVPGVKLTSRQSGRFRALRLAAAFVLTLTLLGGLTMLNRRTAAPLPVVLDKQSAAVMNTPLGSLVYYEEFAGQTVHTQFTSLESGSIGAGDEMTLAQSDFGGYESPLFDDEAVLQDRYNTIISNAY